MNLKCVQIQLYNEKILQNLIIYNFTNHYTTFIAIIDLPFLAVSETIIALKDCTQINDACITVRKKNV